MRAAIISRYGGPEVLEIREVPDPPAPGADQVLVRVRAAGINRADLMQREGLYPAPPGAPADIPGLEFAGEVAALGPSALRWQLGQRVMGITGGGAQAGYILVPETLLTAIPASLDWTQAAALPEVFITAHDAMFTQLGVQLGETVLVHAAASGVGTAAVQLARAAGCTVFGTSRSAEKIERVRPLGLDEAIVADSPAAFARHVHAATAGRGVDAIVDLVGAPYLEANLESLALLGRMVFIGMTGGARAEIDLGLVLRKRLRLVGTVLRARTDPEKAAAVRRFAAHVLPLVERGQVRPIVDRAYPLEEIRAAHQRVESNETFGKVILTL